jgi:O-antigen ligase
MTNISVRVACCLGVLIACALLTTVAGTNFAVLFMLLTTPFVWLNHRPAKADQQQLAFLILIVAFCLWDILTNLLAGHSLKASLVEDVHHVRTFGFILMLWVLFAHEVVARTTLWGLLAATVFLAGLNLALTIIGYLPSGEYFMPSISHLYGQILVGCFFVFAQMLINKPQLSWRLLIPMLILLMSLIFASHRRTGYVLLAGGLLVWTLLNKDKLFGKYRRWFLGSIALAVIVALTSPVLQERMLLVVAEIQQFQAQTPQERTAMPTSVGIRLQYYLSVWDLISQSNPWVGVGSISFPELFWEVNEKVGGTEKTMYSNPHNEYLYILATKGVIGLALYLGIFVQACRVAWRKTDDVQRMSLLVFVFLFLLSITSNSMMIDMEEGHFMMLILLAFLAPPSLNMVAEKMPWNISSELRKAA